MAELLDHRGRPRVAVTGLGVTCPAGTDPATFAATLRTGRSVARPLTLLDPAGLPVRFGCEVPDFDPVPYLGPKESRRVDRTTQLGFAAATDALADAGDPGADPARCGVIAGTGVGGLITLEQQVGVFLGKGASRVSPFLVPMMMANATAAVIGMRYGWTGPNLCVSTACATGANAIGEAARLIREGAADVMLAGGTESPMTPTAISAFARMTALSRRNAEPEKASRPFDVDRDGFVLGEGAGFVMLERLDRARARGVRVYAELAGYGRNADAYHITAPAPGGTGSAACMQLALDDAGLEPGAIGHVNAHGTSTQLNDAAEAEAIHKVFGGDTPPVTANKGAIGHLLGAAGAVEAVATAMSVHDGVVPPTANCERIGDDIRLDVVRAEHRELGPRPAITNSFAFGGHNASLVLTPAG